MRVQKVQWVVLPILALLLVLAGCSEKAGATKGSSSSAEATKVQFHTDSSGFVEPVWPHYTKKASLTFWTWIKNADKLAEQFMEAYPSIQVTVKNVGQGQPQYTKLTTAIQAGSGAPDVVQIEFQFIPQFVNTGGLLDISKYDDGYGKLFPQWTWNQVHFGGKLYAIPQDVGPVGLIYRKDLFDKYGISVPKTWAEYAQAAAKLHSADPSEYITFFAVNDGGWINSLLWQAGVFPFKETPNGWKINFNTPEAKSVVNYWVDLVKKGYVKVSNDWTPPWIHELGAGDYASVIGAAWSPTYEIEPYIPKGSTQQWRAAEIPQWTAGAQVDSNWGGSTNAVTKQTKYPEAAALFAAWINTHLSTLSVMTTDIGEGGSGLFTADLSTPKVGKFLSPVPFLGGQKANEVFSNMVPWVDKDFQWSPWTSYVYNQMTVEFTDLFAGKITTDQTIQNLQNKVTSFARAQGFQVAQ